MGNASSVCFNLKEARFSYSFFFFIQKIIKDRTAESIDIIKSLFEMWGLKGFYLFLYPERLFLDIELK